MSFRYCRSNAKSAISRFSRPFGFFRVHPVQVFDVLKVICLTVDASDEFADFPWHLAKVIHGNDVLDRSGDGYAPRAVLIDRDGTIDRHDCFRAATIQRNLHGAGDGLAVSTARVHVRDVVRTDSVASDAVEPRAAAGSKSRHEPSATSSRSPARVGW